MKNYNKLKILAILASCISLLIYPIHATQIEDIKDAQICEECSNNSLYLIKAISLVMDTLIYDDQLVELKKSDFLKYKETSYPKSLDKGNLVARFEVKLESKSDVSRYMTVMFVKDANEQAFTKASIQGGQPSLHHLPNVMQKPLFFKFIDSSKEYINGQSYYKYNYRSSDYNNIVDIVIGLYESQMSKDEYPKDFDSISFLRKK